MVEAEIYVLEHGIVEAHMVKDYIIEAHVLEAHVVESPAEYAAGMIRHFR